MLDRYSFGRRGEEEAARHFEGLGFRIEERGYRCKIGEIDLICTRGKLLVFAEVKARRSLAYGMPQEAVNARKIRQIRRTAAWYLTQGMRIKRLYADFDMRFDIVEVRMTGGSYEINHIENAF